MTLVGILMVLKSEKPSVGGFAGFLSVLFAFFAFLLMAITLYQLPSTATADQLLPYYLGSWSFVGFHAFFLVFYLLGLDWFKERKWAIYLPILGTLSYFAILWIFTTPATVSTISDGALNWLIMPLPVYAYGGFLAIFYLLLVPLIVLFRVAKTREGTMKMFTWIGFLGLVLWFIAVVLIALVQYTAPFMPIVLGLAALAWIIIFLSWFYIERAS